MKILFFTVFLLVACNNIEPAEISNGNITLQLWSDWKYEDLHGIDSVEGVFKNENEEIQYSSGPFSGGDYHHSPDDLYYEELLIDSVPSKIVKIKNENDIILFLYFKEKNLSGYGHLHVINPDDEQKFITVFKSLKFL